jgi:hypothetical protein
MRVPAGRPSSPQVSRAALRRGPDGGGAHAAEEWVDIGTVWTLARVLSVAAIKYCGPPHRSHDLAPSPEPTARVRQWGRPRGTMTR